MTDAYGFMMKLNMCLVLETSFDLNPLISLVNIQ